MNIIFLSNRREISKTLRVHSILLGLIALIIFSLPVLTGYLGYERARAVGTGAESFMSIFLREKVQSEWERNLEDQTVAVDQAREDADSQLKALTIRMAELQARLVRLDALGERLVDAADLREEEFSFSQIPPVGGPHDMELAESYVAPDFVKELDRLSREIESREDQLRVLENLLANRKMEDEVFLAGRPVKKGWMSSRFGRRTDPFSGHLAWHKGVDFAGKDGSDIISVASGVITWAGKRSGYGYLVEVHHGNGYVTRYGHLKKMLVAPGDIVRKGQVIALMGSTGRSTGPHVHFEVIKDGTQVNPAKYIKRASK